MNPQVPSDGLVLGALAVNVNLITGDQLARALQQWLEDPSQSFGQLLVRGEYLKAADLQRLMSLLAEHLVLPLEAAGDNFRESAEGTLPTVRERLVNDSEELARTLLQTLREHRGAADSHFSNVALTELNSSNQRFRLLRPHAIGGLGMVSVAHDAELDREVAIKEMRVDAPSDDAIGRFMMEARLTGQLDHPGIPPVYALGYFEDGRPFYAMRLIDGVTLKEAVADFHKRFPPPEQGRQRSLELRKLLGAFVSVCHTLRYAHSRHVLHRDIKPSNIMLGGFGETLVLDWGLAKSKEQSLPYSALDAKAHQSRRRSDDPTLTGTGSVMGTPHYMSPEQARGEWDSVNLRSEVYSLGATLYTVLTGKLPFSGTTREAVLEQVRQGQFKPPRLVDSRIAPELDAICTKAMALERQDRFANAGELATEIEHWLADEPTQSYRETASRRWQRWFKSHQTAVAALVMLMVSGMIALLLGTVFVSIEHRSARKEHDRAEEQSKRAERSEKAAEDFVSKFLVVTYNNRLADVPESRGPRLKLMHDAVTQLEAWASESPQDRQRKFDLTAALCERALLHSATHQPDLAWADLERAIVLNDEVGPEALHPRLIPIRLYALSELAELIMKRYGAGAAADFIQPYQHIAQKMFAQNATDAKSRTVLALINIRYAQALAELGRYIEASEVIDSAVTHCELLCSEAFDSVPSEESFDESEAVRHYAYTARNVQAHIAANLGDPEFSRFCIDRVKALCEAAIHHVPGAAEPLRVKLDAMILELELNRAAQSSAQALKIARVAAQEAMDISHRFPQNRSFAELCGRMALLHAQYELEAGSVTRSGLAASQAVRLLEQEENQTDRSMNNAVLLTDAHCVSAEIALFEGDSVAASAHCFAARRALMTFSSDASGLHDIEQRIRLIELLEFQAMSSLLINPSVAGPY